MAGDEQLPDAAKAWRELLAGSEVRIIIDDDADPSFAAISRELFKEGERRLSASTEEAQKIYYDYLSTGKPFGLFLRAFEAEAYRYDVPVSKYNKEETEIFRLRGPQSVERRLYSICVPACPIHCPGKPC